jgi:hypothetical protein
MAAQLSNDGDRERLLKFAEELEDQADKLELESEQRREREA